MAERKDWLNPQVEGENRREGLDRLFSFLRCDLEVADDKAILAAVQDYATFLCAYNGQFSGMSFKDVFLSLSERLLGQEDSPNRLETLESLKELQVHLKSRLNQFISEGKKPGEKSFPLVKTRVCMKMYYDAHTGSFWDDFIIDSQGGEKDILIDPNFVDFVLALLMRSVGGPPAKLKKCPKCGTFFYQMSEKKKVYCSTKCATVVRQKRYLKKLRKV